MLSELIPQALFDLNEQFCYYLCIVPVCLPDSTYSIVVVNTAKCYCLAVLLQS